MQSTQHNQEIEEHVGFESGAVNGLAMLTLNNPFTTTAAAAEPPVPSSSSSANRCTICGFSVKRRSPSSSFLQEPTPKKQQLTLLTSSSSSAAAAATKLLPPITSDVSSPPSTSNSLPILRRCLSDPVNSPGTTNRSAPSTQFLNPQSPDNAKTNVSATTPSPAKSTASLPPLPRALRRSVSDPTRSAPRTSSQSPISGELGSELSRGESPSSKRMKRMQDRMREMIQWWDEVMREGNGQEEDCGCAHDENGDFNGNNNNNTTDDEIAETTETEEAVSVERTGECLIIHFKCPCNKGYQILLSGKNCYYKLM